VEKIGEFCFRIQREYPDAEVLYGSYSKIIILSFVSVKLQNSGTRLATFKTETIG
jgi:hypothetical protein